MLGTNFLPYQGVTVNTNLGFYTQGEFWKNGKMDFVRQKRRCITKHRAHIPGTVEGEQKDDKIRQTGRGMSEEQQERWRETVKSTGAHWGEDRKAREARVAVSGGRVGLCFRCLGKLGNFIQRPAGASRQSGQLVRATELSKRLQTGNWRGHRNTWLFPKRRERRAEGT